MHGFCPATDIRAPPAKIVGRTWHRRLAGTQGGGHERSIDSRRSYDRYANGVHFAGVLTIIESPLFSRLWRDYWSDEEHAEFTACLAARPEAGDLVPGSGGVRKIRWNRPGMGKRGGVRVVYTVRLRRGVIVLLTLYAKNVRDNIPPHVLRSIAEELDHGEE